MMALRKCFKTTLLMLCIGVGFIIILWNQCGHFPIGQLKPVIDPRPSSTEEIECHINGETSVSCRKEGDEVYVPFSFLHKYFEINGKLATDDGLERFEWSHSYSKVYHPKNKYDPRGVFTTFENYNVEVRDRVKCISAIDGVPVSIQWEPRGYLYPTQIAQFGLAHYSKNLTEPEPRRKVLDDGENNLANWVVAEKSSMTRIHNSSLNSNILVFSTASGFHQNHISLNMDHLLDLILSVDILLKPNASLIVALTHREKRNVYYLHYVPSDELISIQDVNIFHGLGKSDVWKHLTRDLIVDLQKGLSYQERPKKKISRAKYMISSIILSGYGMLDNLTLASSEHMANFFAAADWFVKNQDMKTGGWPIPVRRRLASGFEELKPGWLSAMGQGHAISLLARAAHKSGNPVYLQAAIQALRPFRVPAWEGGVLNTFLGQYAWYEEYPTKPASFVLNGFMYALLGLYDLRVIAGRSQGSEAKTLYDQGMDSLKKMLPLYDTGSGSIYDLRHFTLGVPPNIARWDYHATHVNLLLILAGLEKDSKFLPTARHWEDYMQGKRAHHN